MSRVPNRLPSYIEVEVTPHGIGGDKHTFNASYSSKNIPSGSSWIPSSGIYTTGIEVNRSQYCKVDIYNGSSWELGDSGFAGGAIVSDGSNVRIRADGGLVLVHYIKFG